MNRTAFDLLHPAAALLYFAALLALAMTAAHPVYAALALAGALAHRACLDGPRAAAAALAWQVPVVAVVALANFAFVASGSTELFRLGARAFYAESLAYGACSGTMLACVLLVFANASRVLTSDKVMALLGNAVPTVALMVSMAARLVPQFVRRGRAVGDVQRACTAASAPAAEAAGAAGGEGGHDGEGDGEREGGRAGKGGRGRARRRAARRGRIRESLRLSTVLMGWGMEDSLEAADAMRARGWGAAPCRTVYARFRFRRTDALACACAAALAASAAAAAWAACAQLTFYPRIAGFAPWWSYAPFALFAFLPAIMEAYVRTQGR